MYVLEDEVFDLEATIFCIYDGFANYFTTSEQFLRRFDLMELCSFWPLMLMVNRIQTAPIFGLDLPWFPLHECCTDLRKF